MLARRVFNDVLYLGPCHNVAINLRHESVTSFVTQFWKISPNVTQFIVASVKGLQKFQSISHYILVIKGMDYKV